MVTTPYGQETATKGSLKYTRYPNGIYKINGTGPDSANFFALENQVPYTSSLRNGCPLILKANTTYYIRDCRVQTVPLDIYRNKIED